MVGLQGVGKTTTTGKLAKFIGEKKNKKVMVASLDVQRPAAQEQLKILAEQVGTDSLPIVPDQQPVQMQNALLKRQSWVDLTLLSWIRRVV